MRQPTAWFAAILMAASVPAMAQKPEPPAAAPQTPAGWAAYRSPSGMSLTLPPGWTARPANEPGWVQVWGPAGEAVVIGPVFANGTISPRAGAAILAQHIGRRPGMVWSQPAQIGDSAVQSVGRGGGAIAATTFAWVPAPSGSAGMFYVAGAPEAQYRASAPTMAAIFQSVRLTGPGTGGGQAGPGSAAPLQFTRWIEPNERAFAIEVPAGWRIGGGVFRQFLVDLRTGVTLGSGDGQITAFVGDAELPPFATPMPGFPEGALYVPQGSVQFRVAQYRPGLAFATEYAQRRFARACGQVAVTGQQDLREAAARINAMEQANAAGVQTTHSLGIVEFTCRGGAYVGAVMAGTKITINPGTGGGIWHVPTLYGYLAPAERAGEALQALERIATTFTVDPGWAQRNGAMVATGVAIQQQTSAQIAAIINSVHQNRMRATTQVNAAWSEYIRASPGILEDPRTGERYSVWNTNQYNWIDPNGNVTRTDLPAAPNLNMQQLVPPG